MGFIGEIDQAILNFVEHIPAGFITVMRLITDVGSPVVCLLILLAVIAYFYFRKSRQLFLAALILMFALPISPLLKEITRRVRPDSEYVRSMAFQTYSFPSGHAFSSFLVFGFLAYLAWRYLRPGLKLPVIAALVLFIILVGISRVYLGAHFASDVVAGWVLAVIILFIAMRVAAKDTAKKRLKSGKLSGQG